MPWALKLAFAVAWVLCVVALGSAYFGRDFHTTLMLTDTGMILLAAINIMYGSYRIFTRYRPGWSLALVIFWSVLLGFSLDLLLRAR